LPKRAIFIEDHTHEGRKYRMLNIIESQRVSVWPSVRRVD